VGMRRAALLRRTDRGTGPEWGCAVGNGESWKEHFDANMAPTLPEIGFF
jgi:hypothetical protein